MEKEVRKIKKEALQMAWYMRGMSYAEAMNLSWDEREIIGEIIKDNAIKDGLVEFFNVKAHKTHA